MTGGAKLHGFDTLLAWAPYTHPLGGRSSDLCRANAGRALETMDTAGPRRSVGKGDKLVDFNQPRAAVSS